MDISAVTQYLGVALQNVNGLTFDGDKISVVTSDDYVVNGGDDTKRYKFIQNLKNKIKSNQIITKKIYNFKNYEFVA